MNLFGLSFSLLNGPSKGSQQGGGGSYFLPTRLSFQQSYKAGSLFSYK